MNMEDKRSIAELWNDFQKAIPGALFVCEFEGSANKVIDEVEALRATLLERCKRILVWDGSISFGLTKDGATMRMSNGVNILTVENLLDISAAAAFWAYELEQRAKESKGG